MHHDTITDHRVDRSEAAEQHRTAHAGMSHYARLAGMAALSFIAMYVLMYAMVDKYEDVYPNLNQAYMAGLMTAPMVIIELLLMGSMYPSRIANAVIVLMSAIALGAFWFVIREQTAIDNTQFLKSMIPHHSGAILMCREADIGDTRIRSLCDGIITSQQAEIDQMRGMLEERR